MDAGIERAEAESAFAAAAAAGDGRTAAGTKVRRYRAFDLAIASEVEMPELSPALDTGEDRSDLTIEYAGIDGPMPPPDHLRLVDFSEDRSYFSWNGIGRFAIVGRDRIAADPLPGVDHGLLGLVLLGPVMAATLHARGDLVLHGAAIALDEERALLVVGDNGAGKSTLAGAFLKAGHEILTDDVIAIDGRRVRPAFPSMKLSRAAIDSFAPLPGELLPAVPPHAAKLRLRHDRICSGSRRIAHVCILARGEQFALSPIAPRDRLTALLRYSYMLKFGAKALSGPAAAGHFAQCADIANTVPMSILTLPDRLEDLVDAVGRITESPEFSAAPAATQPSAQK